MQNRNKPAAKKPKSINAYLDGFEERRDFRNRVFCIS
jgi:hypothetical protein